MKFFIQIAFVILLASFGSIFSSCERKDHEIMQTIIEQDTLYNNVTIDSTVLVPFIVKNESDTIFLYNTDQIIQDVIIEIDENQTQGDSILKLSAFTNETLTYQLTYQSITNATSIDNQTGLLTIKDSTIFDYEAHQQILISISITGDGIDEQVNIMLNIKDLIDIDGLLAYFSFDDNTIEEHINQGTEWTTMGSYSFYENSYQGKRTALRLTDLNDNEGVHWGEAIISGNDNFTISLFTTPFQVNLAQKQIILQSQHTNGHAITFSVSSDQLFVTCKSNSGETRVLSYDAYSSTPYHLVLMKNGPNFSLYVNGTLRSQGNLTTPLESIAGWSFGSDYDKTTITNEYDGAVDEVRFYQQTMIESEINSLYFGK